LIQKKIVFLYVLVLTSTALFSQQEHSGLKEKLRGTWKKIDDDGRGYEQFLIFTDRKRCKYLIANSPDYPNGTVETPFKYEIDKNGSAIIFRSIDSAKPEVSRRMLRFSSDTLIISVRSGVYFASDRYIRQ
jgi:hypothetical protein